MAQVARAWRLIGRGDALDEARRGLEESDVVQLLGPPGVGKSALRRELGHVLIAEGWRVLEPESETGDLFGALAEAIGIASSERGDRGRTIALSLAGARAALVFDHAYEHRDAVVALLAPLRALAPGVRVLWVSQHALPLPDTRIVELGPLAPNLAIELFLERARAVAALPGEAGPLVASIVHATGGLPQAIELAAARLRAVSLQSLAARLRDGHDTMIDGVIEHALDHASPSEIQALAALATFRGAFSLDDAESLLRLAVPRADPETLLGGLRDQSLLHRGEAGELFVLLPMGQRAFRAVGSERMEELGLLHAASVAASERPRVQDLRAALAVATEPAVLARLAAHLGARLEQLSISPWDLDLLDRAHALAGGRGRDARLVAAVRAAMRSRAQVADAIDAHRALVLACESEGDEAGAARALSGMAQEHFKAFRMVDARVAWERARARFLAVGDARGALTAAHRLAALHCSMGQLAEAEALCESVASEAIRIGDRSALAEVEATSGTLALQRGEHAVAVRRYRESAARAQALSMSHLSAVSHGYAALAELARGMPEEASRLAASAIEEARAIGYVRATGFFTLFRAAALAELDRLEEAAREVPIGLSLLDGVYAAAGNVLAGLVDLAEARAAITRDEIDRAFGRAMSLRQRIAEVRALRVSGRGSDRPLAVDVSDDIRIVLDIVEKRADALVPLMGERLKRDSSRSGAAIHLAVAPGGARFRIDGQSVVLTQRPLLARLLWRMAQRAVEGRSTSSEELVAAGWPDERLPGRIGKGRLYVALADLRKLGLREVITSHADGYTLAAQVEIDLSS